MTEHVLLFGSDQSWCEGLKIAMETEGWSVATTYKLEEALEYLGACHDLFTAAVIDAYRIAPEEAIGISESLRRVVSTLPVLFDISVPDYELAAYAFRCPPVQFLGKGETRSIVRKLQALRNMPAGTGPGDPPRFAVFEVTCEVAAVTFAAHLDGRYNPIGPYSVPWIENRKLEELDKDFQSFRLMEPSSSNGRRTAAENWSAKLKRAGSKISQVLGLDSGAQAAVLSAFVKELKQLKYVHFRFNLPSDRMKHIPFELVWDRNREQHLRELAPSRGASSYARMSASISRGSARQRRLPPGAYCSSDHRRAEHS